MIVLYTWEFVHSLVYLQVKLLGQNIWAFAIWVEIDKLLFMEVKPIQGGQK